MPTGDRLTPPEGVVAWRLDATSPGMIEGLTLIDYPDAFNPLLPHEVRLTVRAAGVNFRDLLTTLGLYPGEHWLGVEGAGVVVEVGSSVTDLVPGDHVMGLVPGAFGPTAVADHRALARIPDGWSFVEAASVPVAFLTAHHALVNLAGVERGESLLVHAAAGGVGTAALRLARHHGVEVFGTAHPRKWDALRAEGVDDDHLASSRTLGFHDSFLRTTRGSGVDVVLNSLTGEFIDASLRLLRDGGRFVELGLLDPRDADRYPGVDYQRFILSEVDKNVVRRMLDTLVPLFAQGILRPLPVTTWDLVQARDAFRFLSQARHTGKIVLTL